MESKENKKQTETVQEEEVAEKATEEVAEEIPETIEIPAEAVTEVADKAAEYKDMLQRLQAEFDNFRKRNAEAVKVARSDGINEMILELLPVMDSFERGLATVEGSAKSGLELICKQLSNLFSKYGVEEIKALGEEFNPNYHHAISQCEDKENENKVIEVFQKGYIRKEKVLRPALVKVAQ